MGSYRCPGYLFDYIGELSEKISGSRYVFLFLDYDGTLTPIPRRRIKLERPLSQYTRDLLASLSNSGRGQDIDCKWEICGYFKTVDWSR
jgi:hypothetical protein